MTIKFADKSKRELIKGVSRIYGQEAIKKSVTDRLSGVAEDTIVKPIAQNITDWASPDKDKHSFAYKMTNKLANKVIGKQITKPAGIIGKGTADMATGGKKAKQFEHQTMLRMQLQDLYGKGSLKNYSKSIYDSFKEAYK